MQFYFKRNIHIYKQRNRTFLYIIKNIQVQFYITYIYTKFMNTNNKILLKDRFILQNDTCNCSMNTYIHLYRLMKIRVVT